MSSDTPYTVSVRLMTYNHAKYIRQAMESILAQQTDFNVEVVVGDDFSTDGTLDIVREYQSTEKIHIRILERKVGDEYWTKRQKLGRLYNFINILENCTGKYIALLDGDDYWVDVQKLQKQVDQININSNIVLVASNAYRLYDDKFNLSDDIENGLKLSTALLDKNPFVSASVLFRNELTATDKKFILASPFGDWALYWALVSGSLFRGDFYVEPAPMVVYRKHVQGVHTGLRSIEKFKLIKEFYSLLNDFTESRFHVEILERKVLLNKRIWQARKKRFRSIVNRLMLR